MSLVSQKMKYSLIDKHHHVSLSFLFDNKFPTTNAKFIKCSTRRIKQKGNNIEFLWLKKGPILYEQLNAQRNHCKIFSPLPANFIFSNKESHFRPPNNFSFIWGYLIGKRKLNCGKTKDKLIMPFFGK